MGSSPAAYDDGVLRITHTEAPPGLALFGEIDESTYPALVSSLDALTHGQPEVHLDLAGVAYCDLAGLRAIVRLAGPGQPDRRVILHRVPGQLRAVLEIIGWDSVPGLSLEEQSGAAGRHGSPGRDGGSPGG
jgi:ABC-type transporter Mla MlaB component